MYLTQVFHVDKSHNLSMYCMHVIKAIYKFCGISMKGSHILREIHGILYECAV